MEQAARALLDDARMRMTSELEENVEKAQDGTQKVFALAALRICRSGWNELVAALPVVESVDPNKCPEEDFQQIVMMNLTLRKQLKESNRIARDVYKMVVGPLSTSTRTQETVHALLEKGVRQVRREMFVLQHGQEIRETEFDEISFSIRDFLQLADFKMSHAAKRIFEVETNASSSDGSGIDWEFRLQELTRDLQAQLTRANRTAEAEKQIAVQNLRQLRDELEVQKVEHAKAMAQIRDSNEKHLKACKTAFETDIRDLGDELTRRIQDLQLAFVHKLGEQRDLDSENKAVAIRALQQVLVAERAKIDSRVIELGSAEASMDRHATRFIGDVAVYEDFDAVEESWEGETHETLVRLLKGKRAEMEVLQQSFNVQSRLKNLEWETNLREVMKQYEEEMGRLREKMKLLEAEAEHATKLVTIRMEETVEARAETQRVARQLHDDMSRQKHRFEADLANLSQQLVTLRDNYSKSAQTVASQEVQLLELKKFKAELLDELEASHAAAAAYKSKVLATMRPIMATADADVQTDGIVHAKRSSMDQDKLLRKTASKLQAPGKANSRQGSASRSSMTPSSDGDLDDLVLGRSRSATPLHSHPGDAPLSRKESARHYFQNRLGSAGTAHSILSSGQSSASGDVVVPTSANLHMAKRGIVVGVERSVALMEEVAHAQRDGDDSPEPLPIKPPQRRKSKFSQWYEEKQKSKHQESGAPIGKSTETSKGQRNPLASDEAYVWKTQAELYSDDAVQRQMTTIQQQQGLQPQRDWITNTLDPEYLAKLLAPDPADAKVLAGDDFSPQRAMLALTSTASYEGPGGQRHSIAASNELAPSAHLQLESVDEAAQRLVNESNFNRIVCKMAVAVEFAASSPAQHTQSALIKKVSLLLPECGVFLNTANVRQLSTLDLICVSQFLETHWQPKILQMKTHRLTLDSPAIVKEASRWLAEVFQMLRNASVPHSISAASLDVLSTYLRVESAAATQSSGHHRRDALPVLQQPPLLRPLPVNGPVDTKGLIATILNIMSFMATYGRAISSDMEPTTGRALDSKSPPVPPTPYHTTAPTEGAAESTVLHFHTAENEEREAMVLVSNISLLTKRPKHSSISHLVEANNVIAQTQLIRRSSSAAGVAHSPRRVQPPQVPWSGRARPANSATKSTAEMIISGRTAATSAR